MKKKIHFISVSLLLLAVLSFLSFCVVMLFQEATMGISSIVLIASLIIISVMTADDKDDLL